MSDRVVRHRTAQRPPRLPSRGAAFPRGPRYLRIPKADRYPISGPGEPPAGFLNTWNSRSEWVVYWGLSKVLHEPRDPRRGPWHGAPPLWTYQAPFSGGRQVRGGAVIDFLIQPNRFTSFAIAIRLQSEYFHNSSFGGNKRALDMMQETQISKAYQVRDLQETSFLTDHTGRAICTQLIRLLSGFTQPDPLAGGQPTEIRGRRS